MKLSCGPLIFFKDFVGVLIHNAKIPLMYLQVLQLGKCFKSFVHFWNIETI